MDDNVRGVVFKIFCDLFNILKGGSVVVIDGMYLCSMFYILIIFKKFFCFYLCLKNKIKLWNSEYLRKFLSVFKD